MRDAAANASDMASLSTCAVIPPIADSSVTGVLPTVSVIIPVKNDAFRLGVCLNSLARQDYPADRYEIIVIDNGSTDDSAAVALRHGTRLLRYPQLRVGALRNRGVEQAAGDILAFVDSDHEVPTKWIRSGVLELQSCYETRMVGSPCLAPPDGTWVQRGWERHRLRCSERREVRWLGAGNMFIRREEFCAIGGFDEDLVAAEDVDLCLRLTRSSGKIISSAQIANIHHGEPKTLGQFFWKEYWRGSSGLRAFFAQGMPLEELPSLVYPAHHLIAAIGLLCAVAWLVRRGAVAPLMLVAILLTLPATLLAAKTSWQLRRFTTFPPLVVLYLTYGFARAAALFR